MGAAKDKETRENHPRIYDSAARDVVQKARNQIFQEGAAAQGTTVKKTLSETNWTANEVCELLYPSANDTDSNP